MGKVIEFDPHYHSCERCVYHDPENQGNCQKPGGWEFDAKLNRCADFRRRVKEAENGGD